MQFLSVDLLKCERQKISIDYLRLIFILFIDSLTLQQSSLIAIEKNRFSKLLDTFLYQNWKIWFFNFYTQIQNILNKILVIEYFFRCITIR